MAAAVVAVEGVAAGVDGAAVVGLAISIEELLDVAAVEAAEMSEGVDVRIPLCERIDPLSELLRTSEDENKEPKLGEGSGASEETFDGSSGVAGLTLEPASVAGFSAAAGADVGAAGVELLPQSDANRPFFSTTVLSLFSFSFSFSSASRTSFGFPPIQLQSSEALTTCVRTACSHAAAVEPLLANSWLSGERLEMGMCLVSLIAVVICLWIVVEGMCDGGGSCGSDGATMASRSTSPGTCSSPPSNASSSSSRLSPLEGNSTSDSSDHSAKIVSRTT